MAWMPKRLAAKIDRLSRTTHRFHRFAHHPLCDEYGGELVRLGRRARVCRGCLLVACGALSGAALAFAVPASLSLAFSMFALGMVSLAYTTFLRRPSRRMRTPKLVSRFGPALAITYAFGRALSLGPFGWFVAALGVAGLIGGVMLYRRRGPDRTPCVACPERNQLEPCRGIAPIVRRERAFRRLAGQWLARVGT